jgi:hypothetical protein
MAKTRTPEQRKTMSKAQKRRYATAKSNGKPPEQTLVLSQFIRANRLCVQLNDLVTIDTAIDLLRSMEGETNA